MMYSHHPDAARLLQPLSREHVLTDPSLALFQKVLLVTDGSVTELLCIHAGKMVRAQKISQEIRHDDAPAALGCPVGTPWLHRRILLVTDDARLVFAESAFVLARLSERARRLLLDTDTPSACCGRRNAPRCIARSSTSAASTTPQWPHISGCRPTP